MALVTDPRRTDFINAAKYMSLKSVLMSRALPQDPPAWADRVGDYRSGRSTIVGRPRRAEGQQSTSFSASGGRRSLVMVDPDAETDDDIEECATPPAPVVSTAVPPRLSRSLSGDANSALALQPASARRAAATVGVEQRASNSGPHGGLLAFHPEVTRSQKPLPFAVPSSTWLSSPSSHFNSGHRKAAAILPVRGILKGRRKNSGGGPSSPHEHGVEPRRGLLRQLGAPMHSFDDDLSFTSSASTLSSVDGRPQADEERSVPPPRSTKGVRFAPQAQVTFIPPRRKTLNRLLLSLGSASQEDDATTAAGAAPHVTLSGLPGERIWINVPPEGELPEALEAVAPTSSLAGGSRFAVDVAPDDGTDEGFPAMLDDDVQPLGMLPCTPGDASSVPHVPTAVESQPQRRDGAATSRVAGVVRFSMVDVDSDDEPNVENELPRASGPGDHPGGGDHLWLAECADDETSNVAVPPPPHDCAPSQPPVSSLPPLGQCDVTQGVSASDRDGEPLLSSPTEEPTTSSVSPFLTARPPTPPSRSHSHRSTSSSATPNLTSGASSTGWPLVPGNGVMESPFIAATSHHGSRSPPLVQQAPLPAVACAPAAACASDAVPSGVHLEEPASSLMCSPLDFPLPSQQLHKNVEELLGFSKLLSDPPRVFSQAVALPTVSSPPGLPSSDPQGGPPTTPRRLPVSSSTVDTSLSKHGASDTVSTDHTTPAKKKCGQSVTSEKDKRPSPPLSRPAVRPVRQRHAVAKKSPAPAAKSVRKKAQPDMSSAVRCEPPATPASGPTGAPDEDEEAILWAAPPPPVSAVSPAVRAAGKLVCSEGAAAAGSVRKPRDGEGNSNSVVMDHRATTKRANGISAEKRSPLPPHALVPTQGGLAVPDSQPMLCLAQRSTSAAVAGSHSLTASISSGSVSSHRLLASPLAASVSRPPLVSKAELAPTQLLAASPATLNDHATPLCRSDVPDLLLAVAQAAVPPPPAQASSGSPRAAASVERQLFATAKLEGGAGGETAGHDAASVRRKRDRSGSAARGGHDKDSAAVCALCRRGNGFVGSPSSKHVSDDYADFLKNALPANFSDQVTPMVDADTGNTVMCHLSCALWSPEVFTTTSPTRAAPPGSAASPSRRDPARVINLHSLVAAADRGGRTVCALCGGKGATVGCVDANCPRSFHLPCCLFAARRQGGGSASCGHLGVNMDLASFTVQCRTCGTGLNLASNTE